MSVKQTPEVLKAARLLGPALGRKASDPGTLRLAAAVLSAEPARGTPPAATEFVRTAKGKKGRAYGLDASGNYWRRNDEGRWVRLDPSHEPHWRAWTLARFLLSQKGTLAPREPWPEPETLADL